jgi:DNA uptake protein ComE-like DNA-binding protein
MVSNVYLRRVKQQAENKAVQAKMQFAALVVTVLGVCMAGMAQYQDRDTRGVPKTSATAPRPEARIDINHASVEELLKAPGMTPSWAGRIVRFRPYRTKQDLLERGVVTSEVYDRIKDYVIAHQKAQ